MTAFEEECRHGGILRRACTLAPAMQPGALDNSTLSPQQIAEMNALLDELLDLPEDQRVGKLRHRSIEDPQVAAALERWLDAVKASSDFLSTPAHPQYQECPPDTTVGLRLGPWRLTRLIGRGGMGDVYEAVRADGEFDQRVAIKLLQRETAGESQRFQRERQILARLEHMGIARLYDGGVTDDRRLYMVMEYVEGLSITDFCALHAATLTQRLGLFIQVCEAVSFAHRHQIIHRDLKASNILVTAEGTVKLLDFGIAQFLDAQLARITQAAAPMTPICAAPEQLTGQGTSPATDVYALGLLLFELLTGTHPWMNHNTPILRAMRTVLQKPAPTPSSIAEDQEASPVPARRIRGDLDAIVGKSLRKEPAHRYSTVEVMKADVIQFLRGGPVEARKHVNLYRAGHTLRRYRWPLVTMAAVALLSVVGWRVIPRTRSESTVDHTVALIGFKNLSRREDVSWLPAALTEMLATELGSVDKIRVVSQDLVRDVSQSIGSSGGAGDRPHSLQLLGRHLGADYLISGDYFVAPEASDPTLRIDITLQDVRTGNSVARFSQQASMGSLTDLIGQIGVMLRNKLGAASPSTELLAQISNAQPPSVDVAKTLAIADEAMQRYDAAKARDELLQVIAEIPGYAPGYASLSDAWSALGYREKAVAAAQQAVTHGSGLPRETLLQIDASMQSAKYQWGKAFDDWNALIKLKPNNPEYHLQAINGALASGAPGAAQAALDEFHRLPGTAEDPRVELAAARIGCSLDDSKSCAEHAQEALRLALSIGAPGLTADARKVLAGAQMHLGIPDLAITNLHAAIDTYRTIGNPRGEAEAHRALGRVLVDQQQENEARTEYQRAMQIGQRIGDRAGVSAVYRDLCEMLWDSGDRDGAQAAAKRGLELSRETGDLKLQAWTLRALATIASDESASDEVMRNYREVTALTERSGDRGGHVWSLATYADMTRLRGEMEEATSACDNALAEASRLTDPQFMVYSTYSCALVEMDRGHPDTASDMFIQVERTSEATKNNTYLADARLMLAEIDMEQGHWDKALIRLGQAIEGFSQIEAKTGQAETEALRAVCYRQIGNPQERDAALARAQTLRAAMTSQLEVYIVDIVSAQLGFAGGHHRDAIAKLNALASDAARRHWLRWSLEARLAAWQLARTGGDQKSAVRLRKQLERSASAHNMGRILARIQQLST
jgi:serine/threonine protein kinase/tetratricopeptide (TPR) repeat protein